MYLLRLLLKNFQGHKNFEVRFVGPGVNIITGDNDAGKTTIFRAIYTLATNRPTNPEKAYITDGEKIQKIVLETTDHRIIRKKNYLSLKYLDTGEMIEFPKFKTNFPEQIIEALPLIDLNWQRQLEKHYLVLQTPGQAGKILENLLGSGDATKMIDALKSKLSKNRTNFLVAKKMIEESTEFLSDAKEEEIDKAMEMTEEIKQLEQKLEELKKERHEINVHLDTLEQRPSCKEEELNNLLQGVEWISSAVQTLENLEYEFNEITNLLERSQKPNEYENNLLSEQAKLTKMRSQLEICPTCGTILGMKEE